MGGGERRLDAREAALALDGLEERRLLAADIGPRAQAQLDIEVESASTEDIAPQIAGLARFLDGVFQPRVAARVFAAQEYPAVLRADGIAGDRHGFDQAERVLLHERAVLERPRLALVGVGHDVLFGRVTGRVAGHFPFQADGEHGPAAAEQVAALHHGQNLFRCHRQRLAQRLVAVVLHEGVEARRVDLSRAGQFHQRAAVDLRLRLRVHSSQESIHVGRGQVARRSVAVERVGSVFAHAQAGDGLVADHAILGRLARLQAEAFLDGQTHGRAAGHVARGIVANPDDALAHGFVVEHRVELDHAMDVGQGHA